MVSAQRRFQIGYTIFNLGGDYLKTDPASILEKVPDYFQNNPIEKFHNYVL